MKERNINHTLREKILSLDPSDLRIQFFRPDEGMKIHQNYYSANLILDVNNMAIEHIRDYYGFIESGAEETAYNDLVDEYNSIVERIDQKYSSEYMEYIHPILVRHSFYYIDMKKFVNTSRSKSYRLEHYDGQYPDDEELLLKKKRIYEEVAFMRTFIDYLDEILPIIKDDSNKSDRIKTYEKMIKKYLVGKYIHITPSGLKIRDSITNKNGNRTMILYDQDEIDLSIVSSGEKKIIILFALQVFYSKCMFLLDEPELSLCG